MNKNKIYLTVAVLSLVGMLGQYIFYETQVEAQFTPTVTTYEKTYTTKAEIKSIEATENAKGCSKLHTNFNDASGRTGTLVFTCDSRDATPPTPRVMTERAFINELASERGVQIVG